MPHDKYCIRADYVAGTVNRTVSEGTTPQYWSDAMIKVASYYQYEVYRRARRLVLEHGLKSVVEFGCGPAIKLNELISPVCDDVVGVDQPSAIEYCRRNHKSGQFLAYDMEAQSFPLDRKFDLVICSDVIEHLVEPDRLLHDIDRASSAQTYIVLSTPDRNVLRGGGCAYSPNPVHVREWNMVEFRAYLESRGFTVMEHRQVAAMKAHLSLEYARERLHQILRLRSFHYCQVAICRTARAGGAL